MNPDNVGTREACKKLQAAGIVLETDKSWMYKGNNNWEITDYHGYCNDLCVPAVSMAEAWRELPAGTRLIHRGEKVQVYLGYGPETMFYNTNPTDALIELRIWLEGQRKEKK